MYQNFKIWNQIYHINICVIFATPKVSVLCNPALCLQMPSSIYGSKSRHGNVYGYPVNKHWWFGQYSYFSSIPNNSSTSGSNIDAKMYPSQFLDTFNTFTCFSSRKGYCFDDGVSGLTSMLSCQKGPTRHAYAWQVGPFWQDTLDIYSNSIIIRLRLLATHRWRRRSSHFWKKGLLLDEDLCFWPCKLDTAKTHLGSSPSVA